MNDEFWMRRALAEAVQGRGSVEPNPMVGAVLVHEGRLIATGHHRQFGGPHAEIEAFAHASESVWGATLFVTLEPCCHFGKTPPCTEAVQRAGIFKVIAAMADPFSKVAGGGFARLREAGIDVSVGVLEDEARRLNAPYLKRLIRGRPFVTAKWAMTLDGKIATATGQSRWISNARSRAVVHEQRGRMDAILIGIGTALADDPALTARPPGPRVASRVVVDSLARLPGTSQLVRTARDAPTIVAVTEKAPLDNVLGLEAAGCEILRYVGIPGIPVAALLDDLGRRGMTNVLVEGGGRLLGAFLDAGEIDAVDVFIAPILEGGPAIYPPIAGRGVASMDLASRLEQHEIAVLDGDIHLRGDFLHTWLTESRVEPAISSA